MKQFLVTWEIDIYADTPREAAVKAKAIMQDKNASANVFEVFDSDDQQHQIDLDEEADPEEGEGA